MTASLVALAAHNASAAPAASILAAPPAAAQTVQYWDPRLRPGHTCRKA